MEMKEVSGKEVKAIIGIRKYDVDSVSLDEHDGEAYCICFEGKYFYTLSDIYDCEIEDNITFYMSVEPVKAYKLKEFFSRNGTYKFFCCDCYNNSLCFCDCEDCLNERDEKGGNLQVVDNNYNVVLYTSKGKLRNNKEKNYTCVFLDKDHFVLYNYDGKKYYTNYDGSFYAYECDEKFIAELIGEFCDKEVWENPNSPFYFLKEKIEDYIVREKWRG